MTSFRLVSERRGERRGGRARHGRMGVVQTLGRLTDLAGQGFQQERRPANRCYRPDFTDRQTPFRDVRDFNS